MGQRSVEVDSVSLYGGTPKADYDEIVRRWGGRQVNLSDPEASLVLMKPLDGGAWRDCSRQR